jgi:DNA-binding response OmpR family regulator
MQRLSTKPTAAAESNMSNGLILVIDDELDTLEFIQVVFSKRGYEVVGTPHAREGLRLARERQPAVILIDLMLPDVNGFEACRQLRADAQTAHVPLVVLSARNSTADRTEAANAGADRYLVKPVTIKVLVGTIEELLKEKGNSRSEPAEMS